MLRRAILGMSLAVISIGAATALAYPNQKEPAGGELAKEVAGARELWQTGRYGESLEAFEALEKKAANDPKIANAVALGKANALESQGQLDKSEETLTAALKAKADDADLNARLADLNFRRGRWAKADEAVAKALKAKPEHLLARWVQAQLLDARGDRKKADESYKWFVTYHNAHEAAVGKDAEALLIVGQAAERYYKANARGQELGESLNSLINNLYEPAIQLDSNCWQAAWLQGRLFLSGYQEGDAQKELKRALEINPQAAEVLVTLGQADLQGYKLAAGRKKAERALEINPAYGAANVLIADLNISDERFKDAHAAAKKAVEANPRDEDALARLAASCRLLVDPLGYLAAEAVALSINPRPAIFYAALAERLSDRRKYPDAERAFLKGIAADPERADTRIGLGMLYMQIGREAEARSLFDAAFSADPFNVRAENMQKILKHMAKYTAVTSAHYSVLVDPEQDTLLGKYMAKYLESIHGELTTRFGYNPPVSTSVQIMKDHEKFSGRTVALPFIPTVGACTGKVVALASPRSSKQQFNWARVLKHEIVHVITLQQTRFNIPHWYTEALAVESEGYPRPQPWNKMLLERVPARRLLNLDTINLGFIRPTEADERQLAYCQAQLYAQYMLKRFGPDSLMKLLDAYRRGETTDQAVKSCFNVEKKDFEAKYIEFLDEVLKTIRTRVSEEKPIKFSELEKRLKAKPDDPDLNARMAYEHYARRDYKLARPLADKALKLSPKHALASYVKARLLTSIGDDEAAMEVLEPALDPRKPNERVVDLLADLKLKEGKLDEAEALYEMARKDDPQHSKWIASLARVHLRQKAPEKLLKDLAHLAENDADDIDVRKTLAERNLTAKAYADAERWARECLYIDVYDPSCHVLLADALSAQKKFAGAVEEYEVALSLKPKKADDLKVKLAGARLGLGEKDAAKAILDEILKRDPEHPEALKAREEIK